MSVEFLEEYSEVDCHKLFDKILPDGFSSDKIKAELVPNGWEASPFFVIFHPTLEKAYEDYRAIHINIQNLFSAKKDLPKKTFQTFEAFAAEYKSIEVEPDIELQELLARCIWDVFSDNNDVINNNKRYHIGSFRGAARFIAERLNKYSKKQYDYMDFYMGSFTYEDHCDLTPIYEWIFKQLKNEDCDWLFHFTQLGLVDFGGSKNLNPTPMNEYDPNLAIESELKENEDQKKKDAFREKIEEINAQEREDALYKPPPYIVQAYKNIYHKLPVGWVSS
jgi:hypothetical protein